MNSRYCFNRSTSQLTLKQWRGMECLDRHSFAEIYRNLCVGEDGECIKTTEHHWASQSWYPAIKPPPHWHDSRYQSRLSWDPSRCRQDQQGGRPQAQLHLRRRHGLSHGEEMAGFSGGDWSGVLWCVIINENPPPVITGGSEKSGEDTSLVSDIFI